MLRPEYLSRKLTSPLPTKDGGTLRTIGEACEYMAAIGKEREQRLHWQRVRELMLQEADEAAVTWRVQLAVLKDAKLDVTALSEPIERMIGEAPEELQQARSQGELGDVATEAQAEARRLAEEERRREEELQQAEARRLAEEERHREEELQQAEAQGAPEQERGQQEELQQAEARRLAEEERRREEELQQAEARRLAEEKRRREEELQQAEARRLAEEERRRQEAENRPFWRRFWPYSRP